MKVTQLRRFGLLLKSTLAVSAMLVVSACGEDPATTAGTTAKDEVKFKLGTVNKLDLSLFKGIQIKDAKISEDEKTAYVLTANNEIYRGALNNGLKDAYDSKNWVKLDPIDKAKNGTDAGQATLETINPTTISLHVGKNGLLIRFKLVVPAGAAGGTLPVAGLAYFMGDATKPTYAWVNDAVHVKAGEFNAGAAFDNLLSVTKAGVEHIVIVSNGAGAVAAMTSSVEVGAKKQIAGKHVRNPTAFAAATPPVLTASDDTIYFADQTGLTTLKISDLGADKDIADAVGEEVSAKWAMDTVPTANNGVASVVYNDGKVYVSLNAVGANTGGIAIYNVKGAKFTAPEAKTWSNRAGGTISKDDGKVRTILNNVVYSVNDDTTIGDVAFAKANIDSNKFSTKLLATGENVAGKTYYRVLNDIPGNIESVVKFGNDVLVVSGAAGNFTIHTITFEERTVGSFKGETEAAAQ